MLIAIDGPAASGKGTLAKRLAAHFGLPHLDTGLLYRAVAFALLEAGGDPGDADAAEAAARRLDLGMLDDERLRGNAMSEAASIVAAIPAVRAALLELQQTFARRPGGAVLDGRDIGSVVAPEADVKIFVTARPEIRARRRAAELALRGEPADEAAVLADILRRDVRDGSRRSAPLTVAPGAQLLDTSDLDIEASFRAALAVLEGARSGARGA
jgi:cytidylate kinase